MCAICAPTDVLAMSTQRLRWLRRHGSRSRVGAAMAGTASWILACSVLTFTARAGFVLQTHDEMGSVKLRSFQHLDASFGLIPYGHTISGFVHYVGQGCKPMGYSLVTRFRKQVVHRGGIVLADRGGCTLVHKVRFAQQAGAELVLIADNLAGDHVLLRMADRQESGLDITIPSAFISYKDGQAIQRALETATATRPPKVRAEWNMARQGDGSRSVWEFWTDSFDPDVFRHRDPRL